MSRLYREPYELPPLRRQPNRAPRVLVVWLGAVAMVAGAVALAIWLAEVLG